MSFLFQLCIGLRFVFCTWVDAQLEGLPCDGPLDDVTVCQIVSFQYISKNISRFTKNIFDRSLPSCPSCARAADAMASRRSASMARFVWRLWGGAARGQGLYSSPLILWRLQTYTGIWNPGTGQKLVFSSSYTCVGNDHHTRVCVSCSSSTIVIVRIPRQPFFCQTISSSRCL